MSLHSSRLSLLFLAVAGCFAGAVSVSDAEVDVTGVAEERFGFVLKAVGDVNGDGHGDFVVSAPNPGSDTVYVFFGPLAAGSLSSGDADAVFTGPANSEAGWAVDGGDLTGDGVADLVIGAPSATSAKGVVYVLRGPLAAASYTSANAWATLTGASTNDILGTALAIGDYSGDGRKDLVVGAPWANSGAMADAGKVYVVRGPLASGSRTITTAASWTFTGAEAGALTGWSLDCAGSMDASGGEEIVVGAPRRDTGALGAAGAAYIVWSGIGAGTWAIENAAIDVAILRGERQAGELGWAVAGGGDVNGDGYDDVLLGASSHYCALDEAYGGADGCASDHGTGHLVGGGARVAGAPPFEGDLDVETQDMLTVTGAGTWSGFADAVAIVGDTDGDGQDEMLFGSLANTAYLFYGGAWTGQELAETQAHATITGAAATDYAGVGVGAAGDLDEDGYADLLVGAPAQRFIEDGAQPIAGKAYVFFGSP